MAARGISIRAFLFADHFLLVGYTRKAKIMRDIKWIVRCIYASTTPNPPV